MAVNLQLFLFLFKSKYRRKCNIQEIFICLVIIYSSVLNVMCSAKCSDVHCVNGECINGTCVCFDGWQGPSCQFCGGKVRLSQLSGHIHDGAGNYSIDVKCSWLVDAKPYNASIRLHIEEFATECGWDHLYVFDGDSVHSPLLAVFSGLMYKDSYAIRRIPEVVAHSGSALLHFYSDVAYNMTGFNISYRLNSCPSSKSSVNCSGHGVCLDGVCTCDAMWMGEACDQEICPNNCSYSNGVCNREAHRCDCEDKYKGEDCSQVAEFGYWEVVQPKDFQPDGSASHTAVVWRDSLYIVGGESYNRSQMMYIYDFNGNVWETPHLESRNIPRPRYGHSAVLFGDKIYMYGGVKFGGEVCRELWAFDVSAKSWENITVKAEPCLPNSTNLCGPMHSAGHTATLVTNKQKKSERMVVIFGHSPIYGYLNTVQEYHFGTRVWSIVQTTGFPVKGGYGHSAAWDSITQRIYVYGGLVYDSNATPALSQSLYAYEPFTHVWRMLTPATSARFLHTASFLNGLMLVFGGNTHNDTAHSHGAKCYSHDFLAYDVTCDSWSTLAVPAELRADLARFGQSAAVFENSLYIYGGFDGQMLNDMLRYTPGVCSALTNPAQCVKATVGVKCVWHKEHSRCVPLSSVPPLILNELDKSIIIKCPEVGRESVRTGLLTCQSLGDCTSCVHTSLMCGWCPASNTCTHDLVCNVTASAQSKCPEVGRESVRTGLLTCQSLGDCTSCVHTSLMCGWCPASNTCTHEERCKEHIPNTPGYTTVRPVTSEQECGAVSQEAICSQLHSCQACAAHPLCHWHYGGPCKPATNLTLEDQQEPTICPSSCAQLTSCLNCTVEECIWCQNEEKCVDKTAYTASFPYGQCREWTTHQARCRATAGRSQCNFFRTCFQCRDDPECGWCDDGSGTGLGDCLPGGNTGPHLPHSCPSDKWFFTCCPTCQCNGHSTCSNNSSVCNQPCANLTQGPHCERCVPGYHGNPVNGGRCIPCECNDHGSLCDHETGKCYCTTKGIVGDHCERCDAQNHYHGDPTNHGSCFYDLTIDYQFTFNLSKKDDRHYTQINFKNSPPKPDVDADFSITCSVMAKMNITIKTATSPERPLLVAGNCSNFRSRFTKTDHHFGVSDNVTLTTFYVYVYDFHPPLWIQISFSQYPKLNLQQFFITFSSCFLLLLLVAAVLWKIKQRYDMYRRRQRMFVEMEQMASRPFSQVLVEIEKRDASAESTTVNNTLRRRKKDSPSPIALEPCCGNRAAVLSLLVRLPTGGERYTPPGQSAGLAIASALVTLGNPRKVSLDPTTKTDKSKSRKSLSSQHPDSCM
ncbi:attractin-like protein 1 [Macrosteles quadrilineatus]|uniref:attractin-like protein 1 n=1 Tax=Macrosteles quadrilineatus TaxID=74068 RepID=UPI0023E3088F|nr:attractin-like protein 1 [Macrosteles quadrilineatus]